MKKNCTVPSRESYPTFGGRGIEVYRPWAESFSTFIKTVGLPARKNQVLGRRNKRRGFVRGNVKWMASRERQLAKRDARLVTISDAATIGALVLRGGLRYG